MKNIQLYEGFFNRKKHREVWDKNRMPYRYEDRYSRYYKLPKDATILQKTERFFDKIEDRISRMASYGSQLMKQRRSERGPSSGAAFNTGVESLFGLPAVVPYVLKRVFSPPGINFGSGQKDEVPKDDEVNLEWMRHTDEQFIKKDLPKIKNEDQMVAHIGELYKKAGVKPRQNPVLDDIVRNRYSIFSYNQMYPNRPILQP
jgi:hypothetical protein